MASTAIDVGYSLDDRYDRESGRVFLTGTQALVRLVLEQAAADRARGLETAGFVSGYRGSPLGGVDLEMWRAAKRLEAAGVRFQPAINEDLAAAAVLGTQRVEGDPARTVAGVFALWYGKGPGVDRAGDALKHGNAYGSSPHGGVLVVAGDDHGAVSSSMPFQSDLAFMAWSMPVIHPASVAEYVPFGLWGYALSRFCGAWVGFKAMSEVVESAGSVALEPLPVFSEPSGFAMPAGGLHQRWPDLPSPRIEERLLLKLAAARAFARANPLDRLVIAPSDPRLLIVTVGKAHADVMEALRVGGLSSERLADAGVAVLKIGLVHPLETSLLERLAERVEEVLVVEEKAPAVERQLKDALYNAPRRPRVLGKADETGAPLIPAAAELRPSILAPILAARLARLGLTLDVPEAQRAPLPVPEATRAPARSPYFCSGCPHSTSTRVPEGSEARAGIGCHFMAAWMDRSTVGIVPMGAEGVDWTGQAPFTAKPHVFQNLGDGTYFHSGHLAIRQAVAAGVNVTYKILYNDAVAMTGGQPIDGALTVPQITRLVDPEGVKRIAVVSDDPSRYDSADPFAPAVTVHHRDDLDAVQRSLREVPGVTVLVYDQTCAAEKRRRRKRGTYPDPGKRVVINELVCEGCGDCQVKSNCLSVVPVDTEFGRKRQIDQSSCNMDFSCVKGFCPSFVTVEGGTLRHGAGADIAAEEVFARAAALPPPLSRLRERSSPRSGPGEDTDSAEGPHPLASGELSSPASGRGAEPHEILVAGVGGTGVVTIGALITMAAHLEGKGASVLDFTGFAQKGGQVLSFVRIAEPAALNQVRIDRGRATAVLACDLVVAASREALGVLAPGRTRIVANSREIPTGAMLRDADARVDTRALEVLLARRVGEDAFSSFDASVYAHHLVGDAQQANVLLLGYGWQGGLVPVSLAAMERAIALNGVAVEANRRAFAWGRLAAGDPEFTARHLGRAGERRPHASLAELVERRAAFLEAYHDAAYAARYRRRVEAVAQAERRAFGEDATEMAEAVAKSLFKLMAYKDEYEVARLYTDGHFVERIRREFDGDVRLTFHLAPPLLSRIRPGETEPRKMTFGPWMLRVFRVLAQLKRLRGTALDPFGYTAERRRERALIDEYERLIDTAVAAFGTAPRDDCLALLRLPLDIRGFGPVKERAIDRYRDKRDALLARLATPETRAAA